MTIPLFERGDYYRGLLVLIKKDRVITDREREMLIQVGKSLDFDTRFCEAAIDDLMKNPHIKDRPMKFSDKKIAESFVLDGLRLAYSDGDVHPKELDWLKAVSRINGLRDRWLNSEIRKAERRGRIEKLELQAAG